MKVHLKPPKNFRPIFEVVSCFCRCKDELLLLHRQDNKSEGNTWGMPAGKVDEGETALKAMTRELLEETGIILEEDEIGFLQKVYVRYPEYDFAYHMFNASLTLKPKVIINPKEHKAYTWATPKQSLSLNLVRGLDECIKLFYIADQIN